MSYEYLDAHLTPLGWEQVIASQVYLNAMLSSISGCFLCYVEFLIEVITMIKMINISNFRLYVEIGIGILPWYSIIWILVKEMMSQ